MRKLNWLSIGISNILRKRKITHVHVVKKRNQTYTQIVSYDDVPKRRIFTYQEDKNTLSCPTHQSPHLYTTHDTHSEMLPRSLTTWPQPNGTRSSWFISLDSYSTIINIIQKMKMSWRWRRYFRQKTSWKYPNWTANSFRERLILLIFHYHNSINKKIKSQLTIRKATLHRPIYIGPSMIIISHYDIKKRKLKISS